MQNQAKSQSISALRVIGIVHQSTLKFSVGSAFMLRLKEVMHIRKRAIVDGQLKRLEFPLESVSTVLPLSRSA